MDAATDNKNKLDRMRAIVSALSGGNRDIPLCQELTDLAWHFDSMTRRRKRLEAYLSKLSGLKQNAAIEKCWSQIGEVVYEFSTEIEDARSPSAGYISASES